MKKAEFKWVVVCDGRKSLIFHDAGTAIAPKLQVFDTREQENPPTRAQGSSAPSRVHESTGHARSALEQTDLHDTAEREFVADLAKDLDDAARAGKVRRLVIVAPARALGMIRERYTDRLRAIIDREIDKDLTKLPVPEIEEILARAK
jgi:protein required for attachment to host cells